MHPQAFLAAVNPDERAAYVQRAHARVLDNAAWPKPWLAGGRYERAGRPAVRPGAAEKGEEAHMLLDPASRLGADGVRRVGPLSIAVQHRRPASPGGAAGAGQRVGGSHDHGGHGAGQRRCSG